jgi:putative transposase
VLGYAWRDRPESMRTAANRSLSEDIRRVHADSRQRYGSPRVHAALRAEGRRVGRNRVARLMQRHGIRARQKRRFCRTTDSHHGSPLAPNLLARQFTALAPDRVWLADITYIPTAEGWLYLAAILDMFSRRIVGWAMDDRITQELTLSALRMAIVTRHPKPGLLHHSDRGSQYAAHAYRHLLADHGMLCSMSRKANCWDNGNHSAWAAGCLFPGVAALQDRGVFPVHLDEVREGLDSEVRECHDPLVGVPVDPDDAVFGVHLFGDLVEPVHALAEFLCDTVNRFDGMNLVDVHDQAAWAGLSDEWRRQFHGNSSSSR